MRFPPVPPPSPSSAPVSAQTSAASGRLRRVVVNGLAAAAFTIAGAGIDGFGPRAAQAGPLSIAARADIAPAHLTQQAHYNGWRHRHRRAGGGAAAAAALGAFGLIVGAAIASNRCRYVDPWGRCVRHRSYYYGPSYYPAYVGGYYPAYRRRAVYYHPRIYRHRYVTHHAGPRFVVRHAGPRFVHRGGGPRVLRHRR